MSLNPVESMSGLAIVVLSYGEQTRALELIESLLVPEGAIAPAQVLHVHNPAHPGETGCGTQPNPVLTMPRNLGYAGGMNAGVRHVREKGYEFVLLLTHDVEISTSSVWELLCAMRRDSTLVAVGPVLSYRGRVWSAGRTRRTSWRFPHVEIAPASSEVVVTASLDGSAMMFRTDALGMNPFDETLFMYYEETDLLERLTSGAGKIGMVPTAVAESEMGGPRRPNAHAYLMMRNGLEVAMRYGGPKACLYHTGSVARDTAVEILRALKNRSWPRLARGLRIARAQSVGATHFLLRKFGPPPARLRDGDLRVSTQDAASTTHRLRRGP